jgi:3-hydroxypropanoate dehydrogenase
MRNQFEPRSLAAVKTPISQEALDQLFREARTHSTWLPEPVPVELLRKAYVPASGNVDKTMAAPVTAIIAWDMEFHENFPRLFPQADVRSYFVGNKPLIEENAFRNSSLQAA